MLGVLRPGCSTALVTPQNWLFLGSYQALRERLLRQFTWNVVAKLGPGAFETISGEVVNVALFAFSTVKPGELTMMAGVDVSEESAPPVKASMLSNREPTTMQTVQQASQLRNPDAKINFTANAHKKYLEQYAMCRLGLGTGDLNHYYRQFWEVPQITSEWSHSRLQQSGMA